MGDGKTIVNQNIRSVNVLKSMNDQIRKLEFKRRELRRTQTHAIYNIDHDSKELDEYYHRNQIDNGKNSSSDRSSSPPARAGTTTTEALFTELIPQSRHEQPGTRHQNPLNHLVSRFGTSNHVTGERNLLTYRTQTE